MKQRARSVSERIRNKRPVDREAERYGTAVADLLATINKRNRHARTGVGGDSERRVE